MKSTILKRAAEGAAIIVSSHLLHLVEELCDRILILKEGKKIIHGSLEEISRSLPELRGDASLEEIFFRVTGHSGNDPSASSPRRPPFMCIAPSRTGYAPVRSGPPN